MLYKLVSFDPFNHFVQLENKMIEQILPGSYLCIVYYCFRTKRAFALCNSIPVNVVPTRARGHNMYSPKTHPNLDSPRLIRPGRQAEHSE